MAAKQRLAELVAQHAPVLYMHPHDHFMPCTVEWFMHHSELRVAKTGAKKGTFHSLIPRGEVNARLLAQAAAAHGASGRLQLDLDEQGRAGFPKELIDDVPLYVNAKEVCRADGSVEALELNYMTFYAHNGSYGVAGMRLGAHDGDWEHLTVRAHPESGALLGIYFHAHRNHDGCWLAGPQVQRTPDGRPIAYVALHGHGTYPVSGKILRALFLVNDQCSSAGLVWRPRRCVLLPHLPHLTPEELRGGGEGRPLMRVWSKGCTITGAESPPVKTERRHNQPAGAVLGHWTAGWRSGKEPSAGSRPSNSLWSRVLGIVPPTPSERFPQSVTEICVVKAGQVDFEMGADGTDIYISAPSLSQQPRTASGPSIDQAETDETAKGLRSLGMEPAGQPHDSCQVGDGGGAGELLTSVVDAVTDESVVSLQPEGAEASQKVMDSCTVIDGSQLSQLRLSNPQLDPELTWSTNSAASGEILLAAVSPDHDISADQIPDHGLSSLAAPQPPPEYPPSQLPPSAYSLEERATVVEQNQQQQQQQQLQRRSREVGSVSEAFSEALSDVVSEPAELDVARPEGEPAVPGGEESRVGAADESAPLEASIPPDYGRADGELAVPEVEVVEDSAEWLAFLGQWGTTPSPASQRWFLNAEPAVSRTVLQRVLHFPSERVAPAKPRPAVSRA